MRAAIRLLAAALLCTCLQVACSKEAPSKSNSPPAASEHGKLPQRERHR